MPEEQARVILDWASNTPKSEKKNRKKSLDGGEVEEKCFTILNSRLSVVEERSTSTVFKAVKLAINSQPGYRYENKFKKFSPWAKQDQRIDVIIAQLGSLEVWLKEKTTTTTNKVRIGIQLASCFGATRGSELWSGEQSAQVPHATSEWENIKKFAQKCFKARLVAVWTFNEPNCGQK